MNPLHQVSAVLLTILLAVSLSTIAQDAEFLQFLNDAYRRHSGFQESLNTLRAFDRDVLSPKDQCSYDLFEWFLEDQIFYQPVALGDVSANDVTYERLLEHYTTTQWTASELYELLENDVASSLSAVEDIHSQLGITAASMSVRRVEAEQMSTQRASQPGVAVAAEMQAYVDTAQTSMAQYFSMYPTDGVVVTQVPGILSIAGFRWGSSALGRPHQVQIAPGRDGVPYHLRRTVSYHEAFPGHYVQESWQKQLSDLPEFRQKWGFRAYNEAWALYAEQLAWDCGLYLDADLLQIWGFIDSKLCRASFALCDLGLHAMSWSQEQAVSLLVDRLGIGESEAIERIDRFLDYPGAATDAYAGFACLVRLRTRMQEALGQNFRLVDFHDLVLQTGPTPMSILTELVEAFISEGNAS